MPRAARSPRSLSPSINYIPRAASSLAQQSLREIFPSVYQHFYFPHVSSAFPRLPFGVCKRCTNKLPRTYSSSSFSFRVPILFYSFFSLSLSFFRFSPAALIRPFHPASRFRLTRARLVRPQHQVNALVTNAPCSYAFHPFITRTCGSSPVQTCA